MSLTYTMHNLPRSHPDIVAYAEAYSQLRLKGLKQSPDSFSSTFEEEPRLSEHEKTARLQHQKRHVIVAAVDANNGKSLCAREWVGSVTILGPMTREEYLAPFADSEFRSRWPSSSNIPRANDTSGETSYWHMTALYVDHKHRRQGLAKKLCDASFHLIQQETENCVHVLRIIIKPENTGVVQMYENMGFASIPDLKATLAEAVSASGEANVDEKTLAENPKYMVRGGLIMLKHL